jgi:general nucleoside transport system permease protein
MPFTLQKRLKADTRIMILAPIFSVLFVMLIGIVIFEALGYDGTDAIYQIFLAPIIDHNKWVDVATKAAPLIIIALGLSIGNEAKVWNIGAEGQYIAGALASAGVAYLTSSIQNYADVVLMTIAGVIGGALWAALPAVLKIRYKVNEVLSSLMFVYISTQLLNYLVTGPWKDPEGFNFPQTAAFTPWQTLPHDLAGTALTPGLIIAVILTYLFWFITTKTVYGFSIKTFGASPKAATYAGFSETSLIWSSMLIAGAMAGLAGSLEATSQLGRLNLGFPSGYGFTAIIVSFLGQLHPIGVFIAGIMLAISYVGGQIAQTMVHVPNATAGLFQALMLFSILASNVLVHYKITRRVSNPQAKAS